VYGRIEPAARGPNLKAKPKFFGRRREKKLTACLPGKVLSARYVSADCAVRSHDKESVDGRSNFLFMHAFDAEVEPSLHWYSSLFYSFGNRY
jgi:hypothetical protein